MSVNITVNGEYMKSCPRHYLLCDQERLKKETENERRKLRIQQVRAASKNMAQKVRNDVEMEKERQLKKIEEIKAKEMDMWRQNILEEKEANFKSAIFQIGTAHRAAKRENEKKTQVKINTKPRTTRVSQNKGPSISKGKENNLRNANVQTVISGSVCPEPTQIGMATLYASDLSSSESDSEYVLPEKDNSSTSMNETNALLISSESSSSTEIPGPSQKFNEKQPSKNLHTRPLNKSPTKRLDAVSKRLARPDSSVVKVQDSKNVPSNKATKKPEPKTMSKPIPSKDDEYDRNVQSTSDERPSRPPDARKRFTQITDFIRQKECCEKLSSSSSTSKQTASSNSPSKSKSKSPASKRSQQTQMSKNASSPSKSKSPAAARHLSGQTLETSTTTKLSAGTSGRVQFYDHSNRFQKEYTQPPSLVQVHSGSSDGTEMNAMEQAALATKLREAREKEMETLRKKTDDRCQKAIEREQVRRACEDLTAKLDALSKQRPLLPSDNHQYSSVRLGQIAAEKEAKLNTAVENILRRPAVITCPPINRHQTIPTSAPSAPVANDLNVGSGINDINSFNSSDSCCSILLGYVNGQTKQITDDIKKYNNQTGETGKVKVEKLQDLLNRINRLRESLLSEIAKYAQSNSSDKEVVQKLVDSVSQFRKERDSILTDNTSDEISKREKDLKKKEAILEQKLKEFYKTQKAVNRKAKTSSAEVESESGRSENDNGSNVVQNSEEIRSFPQKSKATEDKVEKDKVLDHVNDPETQIEKERKEKERVSSSVTYSKRMICAQKRERHKVESTNSKRDEVQPSGGNVPSQKPKDSDSRSTEEESEDSYEEYVEHKEVVVDKKPLEIVIKVRGSKKAKKSIKLPSKSPRKLSTLIQSPVAVKSRKRISTARSNDSSSTSYRSLPTSIHNGMDDLLKKQPLPKDKTTTVESRQQNTQEEETSIKKKSSLNPLMAHYVQRLLGMSRSSINALGMLSSEIETPSSSLVNTTANLSSTETEQLAASRLESVQKFIEENYSFINEFEESLRLSNAKDSSLKTAELAWKKALKDQQKASDNRKEPETKSNKATSTKEESKPSTEKEAKKPPPVQVDKSTQLTDGCTQRIAELSAMIDKIRQEKQKLLETTFSSVSETGPNSTEYLELPDRQNDRSTSKSLEAPFSQSSENLPSQSLGPVPQLEKNTAIGRSRDSGISLSRPITVLETPEASTENLQKEHSSTESLSAHSKPPRPPISIARYSPQLVEDIPHELSTIFEVETPATSKMNTSLNGQKTDTDAQLQDDQPKEIVYKKFPSFEEYARLNQLDMSQFDPEFSVQFEKEFNEFMQLAKDGKVADYEQFTSFSRYVAKSSSDKQAAEELFESLKMANLSFKTFPTRKEYLSKMGISTSDMLDSQSLEYIDDSKNCNLTTTSSESLLNIEKELKQRKLLTKPFRHNTPAPAHFTSAAVYPHRNSELKNLHNEISGITQLTSAPTSSDDQSENLEQELQRLGINWHSAMKKKTLQAQALSSTSSSLEQVSPRTKRRHRTQETSILKESRERTVHTEEGGRQLNIREFLTRELLKRTTTSSSISFSDDSIASSILRSIIGSITSSPHPADAPGPTLERHKTSTPMASHSTSISGKIASKSRGSSSQLFSGESLLSSVHFTNHSAEANRAAQKAPPSESKK